MLDGTFACGHGRSPSTFAVVATLTQELKARRPIAQPLVFSDEPGGQGHTDLGAVLIPPAVHVIDLERAGSALAPRAGIAVGREDTLARVHRLAV